MASVSSYLLDSSLIEYTNATVRHALDHKTETLAVARARAALEFFVQNLDNSIPEEQQQLELYKQCLAGLTGGSSPPQDLISKLSAKYIPASRPTAPRTELELTPARQVLELPDTLSLIIAQIPKFSLTGRKTLAAVALTSRSLHYESQIRLWSIPRDLDSVERQVRFAFATAISSALGESLGVRVRRIAVRWLPDASNARILYTIASQCPNVTDLVLHWGDTEDPPDAVTPEIVQALFHFLSLFPKLNGLDLCKFSPTTRPTEDIPIPPDLHLVFSRLHHLRIDGYSWTWLYPSLVQGLGEGLQSLHIGFSSLIAKDLAPLAKRCPSLTDLMLKVTLELSDIQAFVEHCPNLTSVQIIQFSEQSCDFIIGTIASLIQLEHLSELDSNLPLGLDQISSLSKSPAPLSVVSLTIEEGLSEQDCEKAIIDFILRKKDTLSSISFSLSEPLSPTDALVDALSHCPNLKDIELDLRAADKSLTPSKINVLLTKCPSLQLTNTLEILVQGNELYQKEYKEKLEEERKGRDSAWEDNTEILGN